MEIDKVTYEDLSVFNREEEFSIFHKLNFTRTVGGKDWLYQFLTKPFSDLKQITETQKIISLIIEHENEWPLSISNGTIMVMEKFYETSIDEIPASHDVFNAFIYQFFHKADHSLVKYTISHFADFIKAMNLLIDMFDNENSPTLLRSYLQRAKSLLNNEMLISLSKTERNQTFPALQVVSYGNYIRGRFKSSALELIDIYSRLDAWYSMAISTKKYNLTLPKFFDTQQPCITANSLYHILLPEPVAYDIELNQQNNFLFLTGANMAGKSTFIKAVGIAVYLAHLGMGVPAQKMELSLFDGVLSNINIEDNISKGESYFFNEVQRVKNTILKINDSKKWLVLIDELFKGTNVQDAMKCSSTVIKGLIKIKNSLFILSTHLYEIGEELKQYPNISFKYFETSVKDDQLDFNYQLKDGISNDRLGYLILKREKVIELLEKL
jgi:DNA mismatch repair protein MutS